MPRKNSICWSAFYISLRWVGLNLTNAELICTKPVKEVCWETGFVFTGAWCCRARAAKRQPGQRWGSWAGGGGGGRKDAPVLQQLEDGLGNFPRGTQDVCDWDKTRVKADCSVLAADSFCPSSLVKSYRSPFPNEGPILHILKTPFELRRSIPIASACICESFVQPHYKAAVQCLNYPDNPVCLYF